MITNIALTAGSFMSQSDARFGVMCCDRCGKIVEVTDLKFTPDDLMERAEDVINEVKKAFVKMGWFTSWGYDLCPACKAAILETALPK
jgi:hypothetical protein